LSGWPSVTLSLVRKSLGELMKVLDITLILPVINFVER
jgi:hypothetical protein